MLTREIIDIAGCLDRAHGLADAVQGCFADTEADISIEHVRGRSAETDFVTIVIPGKDASAPVTGIIGLLGGVGARPAAIGMVSDAEGCLAALAAALKIARMAKVGDRLPGDVIVTTHLCPSAPTMPHDPVPFMDAPVDAATLVSRLTDSRMDAVLSIDTSRGNRLVNHAGIAVTPVAKQGWLMKPPARILDILEAVTGAAPVIAPLVPQDITPYGNGLAHFNGMMQPATRTDAPVMGVAITSAMTVPGCATGATGGNEAEQAARLVVECAKEIGTGTFKLCDEAEHAKLCQLYGALDRLKK